MDKEWDKEGLGGFLHFPLMLLYTLDHLPDVTIAIAGKVVFICLVYILSFYPLYLCIMFSTHLLQIACSYFYKNLIYLL